MTNEPLGSPDGSEPSAAMTPWASTIPWDCLVRETGCCAVNHNHSPMANDPCAVCSEPLAVDEECYYVTELDRVRGREPAVCWRHVGRTGPLVVASGKDGAA